MTYVICEYCYEQNLEELSTSTGKRFDELEVFKTGYTHTIITLVSIRFSHEQKDVKNMIFTVQIKIILFHTQGWIFITKTTTDILQDQLSLGT
jgi:hypothetical protein